MSGGRPKEMREIIEQGSEAQQRSGELKEQAQDIERKVDRIGSVIQEIQGAAEGIDSDKLRSALENAKDAEKREKEKLEELRKEREELNKEVAELEQDIKKHRETLNRTLENTQKLADELGDDVAGDLGFSPILDGIKEDLEDCDFADAILKEAKSKLDHWKF